MDKRVRKYLSKIGKKGGQKSKRKLTLQEARDMVLAREIKKRVKRINPITL